MNQHRLTHRMTILCLFACVGLRIPTASGQCELAKITSPPEIPVSGFLAGIDGDFIVVNGFLVYRIAGASVVFHQELVAPAGSPQPRGVFDMSDGRMVVGSIGLAYVFDLVGDMWQLTGSMTPSENVFVFPSPAGPTVALDGRASAHRKP